MLYGRRISFLRENMTQHIVLTVYKFFQGYVNACVHAWAFHLQALYVKRSFRFHSLDQMVPVQTKVNSWLIFILMPIAPFKRTQSYYLTL